MPADDCWFIGAEKRKGEPWGGQVTVEGIDVDFFVGKAGKEEI